MNIQQALRKEKRIRRKAWTNNIYWEFHKLTLDEYDILAEDWEVEGEEEHEIPTKLSLGRLQAWKVIDDELAITILIDSEDVELTEKDVDKLLDFLYYNTKIGNDRIIPF